MKTCRVLFFSFILIATLCVFTAYGAGYEDMPTKTVELNVAQYKNVSIGSGTENASYPLSNITDGNRQTFADFTYSNKITIDLEKRYEIKRIEIYSRDSYGNEGWCSNFKVYGSNTDTFEEQTLLEEYGAYDADVFPVKGSYSFDVSAHTPYRYIRLQYPPNMTWIGCGDIRVYSDVEVTGIISPDMTVTTAPTSAYYPGSNLIDGSNDTFVYPDYAGYAFFTVDLGESYPIGMIELDSRADGGDAYNVHYGISTYGSNEIIDNDENVSKSALTEDEGYTKLTWIQPTGKYASYDNTNPDRQFKRHSVEGNDYPSYREICKDDQSFRYVTIKDDEQSCLQASELRLYVINPKAYGTIWDGESITLCFTDVMHDGDMHNGNVTVTDSSEEVQNLVITPSEDGYEINVKGDFKPSTDYVFTVKKDVTNKNGVPMTEDFTFSFSTPAIIEVVEDSFTLTDGAEEDSPSVDNLSDITSGKIGVQLSIANNSPDVDDTAVIFALLYDADGILCGVDEYRTILEAGKTTSVITNGLDVGEKSLADCKLYFYIWRDFDTMLPWSQCKIIE